LLTEIEYVPVVPVAKDAVCDFASASVGVPVRVVGSVAVGVLVAPPPLTATELVTEPGVPAALTVRVMGFPVALAAIGVVLVHVAL
jgi:hypothetical protein